MFPHERSLVKQLKEEPFALIGVNADSDVKEAQKRIEKEDINWRSFFDGRGGHIAKDYRVRGYPTIYVLDSQGVIRYRDVRGEVMTRAVEDLLKEMKSQKK